MSENIKEVDDGIETTFPPIFAYRAEGGRMYVMSANIGGTTFTVIDSGWNVHYAIRMGFIKYNDFVSQVILQEPNTMSIAYHKRMMKKIKGEENV